MEDRVGRAQLREQLAGRGRQAGLHAVQVQRGLVDQPLRGRDGRGVDGRGELVQARALGRPRAARPCRRRSAARAGRSSAAACSSSAKAAVAAVGHRQHHAVGAVGAQRVERRRSKGTLTTSTSSPAPSSVIVAGSSSAAVLDRARGAGPLRALKSSSAWATWVDGLGRRRRPRGSPAAPARRADIRPPDGPATKTGRWRVSGCCLSWLSRTSPRPSAEKMSTASGRYSRASARPSGGAAGDEAAEAARARGGERVAGQLGVVGDDEQDAVARDDRGRGRRRRRRRAAARRPAARRPASAGSVAGSAGSVAASVAVRGAQRQREREGRALARRRLHADLAAEQAGDLAA